MSKRILVVEGQPDSRQIIRDMLARTDYEITEAENGEEALAAISCCSGRGVDRQVFGPRTALQFDCPFGCYPAAYMC